MAQADLTLQELVSRAYARAIPAKKFTKLATRWLAQKELDGTVAEDELATALLTTLVAYRSSPPALLLGYLSQTVASSALSVQTLLVHLLFFISDSRHPSPSLLVSLATLIVTHLPLDNWTLPSTIARPATLIDVPDVGTSASASPLPVSTLGLLLPLIRQCTGSTPGPVIALVGRLLSSLQPYPAPPLDVGLEASGLLQSLPESLSVPLRGCLSGLMAELAISQDTAQLQLNDNPVQPPVQTTGGVSTQSQTGMPAPVLPTFMSQVPLHHALAVQVAWVLRSDRWTDSDSAMLVPPDNHVSLLRLGPHFAADSSDYIQSLLRVSIDQTNVAPPQGKIARWLFVTERIPALLKWWKDDRSLEWSYPGNLKEAMTAAFQAEKESLATCNTWISTTLQGLSQQAENDEESGGFLQPEGWMLCSLEVSLTQRLLDLGLLERSEASEILPGILIPPTHPGESLMNRVASAPASHLKALSHIIAFAPGAARSLAKDVYEVVRAYSTVHAPDGLLNNLSHEPSLLAAVGGCINPSTWMHVVQTQLIDYTDDPTSRAENPQESKSRFGEGMLFTEAFVAHFDLQLPAILQDARRATSLALLDADSRSSVNGWIKALFGSEGIDDAIILATSPPDFYRLAPSLFQQAVLATAYGRLDLDTLHSGLSYFAQPLLSWSLTGVTSWLVAEIQRNGPISAPYLTVLQEIITSSSFPAAILRINGPHIAALLEPISGLASVLQSSSFDVDAVRQKLATIGAVASSDTSLDELRQELQVTKALEIAPSNWSTSLCEALERSLRRDGASHTLQVVANEVLQGSTTTLPQDHFTHLAALFLSQRLGFRSRPLSKSLVAGIIPDQFDTRDSMFASGATAATGVVALCRLVKQVLLVTAKLDASLADNLANDLIDELGYQRSRPLRDAESKGQPSQKRAKAEDISPEIKMAVEAVLSGLAGDEELRGRWQRFAELAGSPS